MLSHVWLFESPWTVACQAPLSLEFSRHGYWSGQPFPSPGDLPYPGIKPGSPALAGGFFTIWATREAQRLLLVPVLGIKPGPPEWKPGILTTKPCAKETRFKYFSNYTECVGGGGWKSVVNEEHTEHHPGQNAVSQGLTVFFKGLTRK